MVEIDLPPDVAGQLGQLPKPIQIRMIGLIERLRDWPEVSGAKPLRHGLKGRYRLRTGDYRLQFRVEGDIVVIEKIGHRANFYED